MDSVLCRELVEKGLGEDDLRLLRDAGYVNRERLNLATREGLRAAKLLPAVVDIIKSPGPGSGTGSGTSSGSGTTTGPSQPTTAQLSAPPLPPPPTGAILPVWEVFADGSKEFLGTLTIISADGVAVTARHVVVWGDGRMHPRRLFVGDGDVQARHLASFPVVDVTLLRLLRTTAGLLGAGSGDSGGAGGGGSSSSSQGSGGAAPAAAGGVTGAAAPFPHMKIAPDESFAPGAQLTVYSYPAMAVGHNLLRSGPAVTHGLLSSFSPGQLVGLADYAGFPGSSGGAVTCGGKFIGIHIEAISHDSSVGDTTQLSPANSFIAAPPMPAASTAAPAGPPAQELGEALEMMDDPVQRPMDDPVQRPMDDPVQRPMDDPVQRPMDDPVQRPTAGGTAAAGGAAAGAAVAAEGSTAAGGRGRSMSMVGVVSELRARIGALQLNQKDQDQKGALSLFTRWHVVATALQIAGIPPPQSGQTRVVPARELATALAAPARYLRAGKRLRA